MEQILKRLKEEGIQDYSISEKQLERLIEILKEEGERRDWKWDS
ncbi:hypothetical protein [Bacillus sp. Bva_UNVM-123]